MEIKTVGDLYKVASSMMERGLKDFPLLGWDEMEFFRLNVKFMDELDREPVIAVTHIPLEEAGAIYDEAKNDEP